MSVEQREEAVLPVNIGLSEGKSLGFAPTAVAGPATSPIGGLNNPVPLPTANGATAADGMTAPAAAQAAPAAGSSEAGSGESGS